jgi:hypothetical protein
LGSVTIFPAKNRALFEIMCRTFRKAQQANDANMAHAQSMLDT